MDVWVVFMRELKDNYWIDGKKYIFSNLRCLN